MMTLSETLQEVFQEKGVTLAKFLYDSSTHARDFVKGAMLWEKLSRAKSYYIPLEEVDLIQKIAPLIPSFVKDIDAFIDLGPGGVWAVKNKTLPFLKYFSSSLNYYPVDISEKFITTAAKTIFAFHKTIQIKPSLADIYNYTFCSEEGQNLVFLSGATIGNLEVDFQNGKQCELSLQLKNVQRNFSDGSYFLITQDTTHSKRKLNQSYANKECEALIMNVFYRIKRDLHLQDFDPTDFFYKAVWNPHIYAMEMFGIATKTQQIIIDNCPYTIPKDFPVPIARSYKLPSEMFLSKTTQAGFEHVQSFNNKGSGIYLHLLRKPTQEKITSTFVSEKVA